MSAKLFQSRRDFLKRTLSSTATLGMLGGGLLSPKRLFGGTAPRRHLINIVCWGGCDVYWFHGALPSSKLSSYQGQYPNDVGISASPYGFSPLDVDQVRKYKLSIRHDENLIAQHPYDSSHYLGYGMTNVFAPSDYADMLIWKGLVMEGAHGEGNRMINQGVSSSYAISFSGIVAGALYDGYTRPLPYVLVASSPDNLFINYAMNRGAQVPICVQDQTMFSGLTQVDPNDIQATDRRSLMNDAVRKLSSGLLASNSSLAASKKIAQSYGDSFAGAVAVGGSDMGNSVEFRYLYKKFLIEMLNKGVSAHNQNPTLDSIGLAVLNDGRGNSYSYISELTNTLSGLAPLPNLAAYLSKKNAAAAAPGNATLQADLAAMKTTYLAGLTDIDALIYGYAAQARGLAFNFAMANYLVENDIAGVVDIPGTLGGDAHGGNLISILVATFTLAGFRLLMENLRNHILPNGQTLLQATTLIMHTEMDREPQLTPSTPGGGDGVPGTNHGYSTTAILAGGGIRGGTVVGDLHRGPEHLNAYGQGWRTPLPIDVHTGKPKPLSDGGRLISTKAIFPTILAAFGVTIPAQQITDYDAVPAVLKS
jgi:hypothetical protein